MHFFAAMTRFQAFQLHLIASAAIGGILLGLLWFLLYPAPLFRAMGGMEILFLLLGVDVTLGPFLTLVIFNVEKKSLRFDLLVVATLQLVALIYGAHALFIGRPVYVAALGHRFDLIAASDVDAAELAVAGKTLPWFGVEWVGTRHATDPKEKERILFSAIGGFDYGYFPQHHVALDSMRAELLAKAHPVSNLINLNPGRSEELRAWLAAHNRNETNTVYQGLKARGEDMSVMINKSTGEVVGVVAFKPWE